MIISQAGHMIDHHLAFLDYLQKLCGKAKYKYTIWIPYKISI